MIPEGVLEVAKVKEANIEDSMPLNSDILEIINQVEQRVSAPVTKTRQPRDRISFQLSRARTAPSQDR